MSDEIITTNTGAQVNVTSAMENSANAETAVLALCNHIDEIDAAHKKEVADFKRATAELYRKLESCELEVARHRKQTLEEISLKLRAERNVGELIRKLEENDVRNLKQKKKIQELENMNRTMKRDHAETFENMKKKVEEAVLRMAAREKAADEVTDKAEPVTEQ